MRKILVKTVSEGSGEKEFLLEYYLLERNRFEGFRHNRHKRFGFSVRKIQDRGASTFETELPCVTNSLENSICFIEKLAAGTATPTSLVELVDDYFFFEDELELGNGSDEDDAARVS